jgi:hypothetical protein
VVHIFFLLFLCSFCFYLLLNGYFKLKQFPVHFRKPGKTEVKFVTGTVAFCGIVYITA